MLQIWPSHPIYGDLYASTLLRTFLYCRFKRTRNSGREKVLGQSEWLVFYIYWSTFHKHYLGSGMLTPTLHRYTTPHSPLPERSLTTPTQLPQVLHTLFLWPEFKPSPGFLGHHPRATYLSFLGHLQLAHDSLPLGIVADNVYLTCRRHWQTA